MSFVLPDINDYIGRQAVCLPRYGWGWSRADTKTSVDFDDIHDAGIFSIRIDGFFRYNARPVGIFGMITESDHLFSGLLFNATLMHKGEYNLTDMLCWRTDIDIGPHHPVKHGMEMTEGSPIYHGYVMIAQDVDSLLLFRRKHGVDDG